MYTVQIILLQYSTHKLCEEGKVTDGEKFPKYCQPWELQAQLGQRWQCHVVFTECYQNQYNTFMSSGNVDYVFTSSLLIKDRIISYFLGNILYLFYVFSTFCEDEGLPCRFVYLTAPESQVFLFPGKEKGVGRGWGKSRCAYPERRPRCGCRAAG